MAREVEYAVVVGDGRYFQADALETVVGSAENGMVSIAETKRYAVDGPAAAVVLKRIRIGGSHRDGYGFHATPIVDGVPRLPNRRYFSAPPSITGKLVPFSVILPVSIDRGRYMTGARGTSFGVVVVRDSSTHRFEVESAEFETIPLDASRGRGVNE